MAKLTAGQVASVLQQLVIRQGRVCAICKQPYTTIDPAVLDHDHDTGYIRGALHRSCNGVEGSIRMAARRSHAGVKPYPYLIGLGKYLEEHSTPKYPYVHPLHTPKEKKKELRAEAAKKARAKVKAEKAKK